MSRDGVLNKIQVFAIQLVELIFIQPVARKDTKLIITFLSKKRKINRL